MWTSVAIGTLCLVAVLGFMLVKDFGLAPEFMEFHARRLSQDQCGSGSSVYPEDLLLSEPYQEDPLRWLIFLHCIGISYMLLGLNAVCDVYFSGALEVMVDEWNVKADVAGATFMAAGGSAPELFTSTIGAFAESDVGFGTIVGSAVFNVLFVIGLCGYAAVEDINLTWWPLFRDCTYYIFGLGMLAWCASDEEIWLTEAIFLFCLYLLYCFIMYHNSKLELRTDFDFLKASKERRPQMPAGEPESEPPSTSPSQVKPNQVAPLPADNDSEMSYSLSKTSEEQKKPSKASIDQEEGRSFKAAPKQLHGKMRASYHMGVAAAERHDSRMQSVTNNIKGMQGGDIGTGSSNSNEHNRGCGGDNFTGTHPQVARNEPSEEEDDGDLMTCPTDTKGKIIWCVSLPIYVPLHYGIPQPDKKYFLVTFALSLFWIAGFSYFLVWWVEILGAVLHIDTIIMGFTLLAAGTSIPDAVSSVAVARDGKGDMAVSSSIGSNIFDILTGLPIPWILKTGIVDTIKTGKSGTITICSPYIKFHVLLLLFMVLSVIVSIHIIGWKLNKTLGAFMALLYIIFLVVAVTVEYWGLPDWLDF